MVLTDQNYFGNTIRGEGGWGWGEGEGDGGGGGKVWYVPLKLLIGLVCFCVKRNQEEYQRQ